MEKDIKVNCPCCDSILIVDRISGKILETRRPLVEQSSGDRLEDAFLKSKQDKEKVASAFDNIKEKQEEKKKLAEDLFNASLKSAKDSGGEKPRSIFDSD